MTSIHRVGSDTSRTRPTEPLRKRKTQKLIIHSPINPRRCSLSHDAVAAGLSRTIEGRGLCPGRELPPLESSSDRTQVRGRSTGDHCTVRWKVKERERERTTHCALSIGGRTTDVMHCHDHSRLPNATRCDTAIQRYQSPPS